MYSTYRQSADATASTAKIPATTPTAVDAAPHPFLRIATPPESRHVAAFWIGGQLIGIVAILAVLVLGPAWCAVLAAVVVAGAFTATYEWLYARAACATTERLR